MVNSDNKPQKFYNNFLIIIEIYILIIKNYN